MKKRYISFCILMFSLFAAHADLYKPHRIFEIGVDAGLSAADSYWGVGDVLQKAITIDLSKIAKEMPKDGFVLGFYDREQVFLNLNLSSHMRMGVSAGVEATSQFSISKDLFELLGSGLKVGSTKSIKVNGYADVFADVSVFFQTIINDFGVKIMPTYFIPLVYVPSTSMTATVSTTQSGKIRANAEANVDIYTAVDMYSVVENSAAPSVDVAEILSNGGFDLTFEMERNWLHGLNAGFYTRIPILPGTLTHKMSTRVYAWFEESNLMGYLNDSESHDYDSGHDDFTYSDGECKAYRPLKLGINASYAPFGEWLKVQPMVGFAVRNPYSSDMVIYPEYALDVQLSLLRMLYLNVGTAYMSQIYQQRIGIGVNLRVIELIAQASLSSTDFQHCFNLNGAGVFVGFRMGF